MVAPPYYPPRRRSFLFKLFVVALIIAAIAAIAALVDHYNMTNNAHRRIGIARLEGTIEEYDKLGSWLEKLRKDPHIRAVLLRIDSSGGTVAASQELFDAVRRLNQTKPVVVSMGDSAASGAYYAALGARHIVANPSTITGSIGVKMILPDFTRLMEKIGVSEITVASGAMKDAGSPFRGITPEEHSYFESLITDLHEQFVSDVADVRKMSAEDVARLADGRAFTGRQALELGLVDSLGTFTDAMNILCSMLSISDPVYVEQPKPDLPLLDYVISLIAGKVNLKLPADLSRNGLSPVFLYLH